MRNRVERLRIWLLAASGVLVLVLAGFIGYARFLRYLHHVRIPGALGVNVVRDANGVTFSHSVGGRTVYTLHAAKQTGYKNGKVSLHGVSIVLYGRDGNRNDRIYGDDFEYDQNEGVVRALGAVHIDLQQGPSQGQKTVPNDPNAAGSETGIFHVLTSNLVYLDKLGVAATKDPIDFQTGRMKGHATGADYSSDSGMLLLHSSVSMSGTSAGSAISLSAGSAEFDTRNEQASLTQAKYESDGRTVEAQHATLHSRSDGTLEKVEANGNVSIAEAAGKMLCQKADATMGTEGRPRLLLLSGGVRYESSGPARQITGRAQEATIEFNPDGKADHATFGGAGDLIERVRSGTTGDMWNTRQVSADKISTELENRGSETHLKNANASGNARLVLVSAPTRQGGGSARTELSADDLRAHLLPNSTNTQSHLDWIEGTGHTTVRQLNEDGVEQTSSGDHLRAHFQSGATSTSKDVSRRTTNGSDVLRSAEQDGHVVLTRHVPAKTHGAGAEDQRASASRAVYDGRANTVLLNGHVQLGEEGSTLWANEVTLDRISGDASADGAVKADYAQPDRPADPMHIVASRAEMQRKDERATFYGNPVRLWGSEAQILASEIEIDRGEQRLIARGKANPQGRGQVHTMLVRGTEAEPAQDAGTGSRPAPSCGRNSSASPGSTAARGGLPTTGAVRIESADLVYSGKLGRADFTGGIRADTSGTTFLAKQASAFFGASTKPTPASAVVPSLSGSLNRLVGAGEVQLHRPGLQATGESLTYTAEDQVFLLSGAAGRPAKAIGRQGSTTGAALRFNSCNDSVEVLNELPGGTPERVRTETRVKERMKEEKDQK